MSRSFDVIIIGAGITGASAAYYLARSGATVALVDKGDPGGEQSGRNWGFVRSQGRHSAELALAVRAQELFAQAAEEFDDDFSWVRGGILWLLESESGARELQDWAELGSRNGITTNVYRETEVPAIAPFLGRPFHAGVLTPNDGHALPRQATQAFARAAEGAGATLLRCTARGLRTAGGAVVGVDTDEGTLLAGETIVAAGVWTRRLLMPLGVRVPTQWIRSSVGQTKPLHPVTEMAVWSREVSFSQKPDGRVTFARLVNDIDFMPRAAHNLPAFARLWSQNPSLFRPKLNRTLLDDFARLTSRRDPFQMPEPRVNQRDLVDALAALQRLVPAWREATAESTWAGYLDGTPDALPIIGPVPGIAGLTLSTGYSGHGFGMGPGAGELIAQLALGEADLERARPFRIERFTEPSVVRRRLKLG